MLCLGISSLILISFSLTVLGLGSGVAGGWGGTIVRGVFEANFGFGVS